MPGMSQAQQQLCWEFHWECCCIVLLWLHALLLLLVQGGMSQPLQYLLLLSRLRLSAQLHALLCLRCVACYRGTFG